MKRLLFCIGALLGMLPVIAQSPSLTIQLSNEQIAIPFTRIAPLHPGLEIGYRHPVNARREWQVHAGGFYHRGLYTGLYLRAAHAWNWQPVSFVQVQVAPGIGYLHTFTQEPLWAIDESGTYRQVGQAGQPHALVELGLGAILLPDARVSPMISYRMAVEAPFATVFPVMFHNFLQVGVSVSLPSHS